MKRLMVFFAFLIISTAMALDSSSDLTHQQPVNESARSNVEQESVLHKICREGRYEDLRSYINDNPLQLANRDNSGKSPLLIALQHYHFAVARLLLEEGGYDAQDILVEEQLLAIGRQIAAGREEHDDFAELKDDFSGLALSRILKVPSLRMLIPSKIKCLQK